MYNNTVLLSICTVCCDLRDNERQQHKEKGGDKRQYNTAVTDVLTEVWWGGGGVCCDGGWLWLLRYSGNIAGGTSSLPTLAIFPGSELSGGIDPSPFLAVHTHCCQQSLSHVAETCSRDIHR